jgi:hypothetical protein
VGVRGEVVTRRAGRRLARTIAAAASTKSRQTEARITSSPAASHAATRWRLGEPRGAGDEDLAVNSTGKDGGHEVFGASVAAGGDGGVVDGAVRRGRAGSAAARPRRARAEQQVPPVACANARPEPQSWGTPGCTRERAVAGPRRQMLGQPASGRRTPAGRRQAGAAFA